MFFKKKKAMNDNGMENEQIPNDNMAQNEEALAKELNTDESVNGMQHLDDEMPEESGTDKLQAELAEMKDKYLRLVAEFENFRKRNAKERLEMAALAGRDVIQPLLEVLDDSYRAESQLDKTDDIAVIKDGIKLVFNKLRTTLQNRGLKTMDAVNQPFDADMHEAITEIPAPSEDMKGKVIDVVEAGYYLNDKIIRHAKVVVGN
jgi:molecular chaperone GrpE